MTAPSPVAMSLPEAMEACMDEQGRTLFVGRDDVSGAQNDKPLWGSVALGNALDVRGPFNAWPEAASNALGFAVVERDDTAELAASLSDVLAHLTAANTVLTGYTSFRKKFPMMVKDMRDSEGRGRRTLAAYRERNK